MKYYLDTEFNGFGGELISLGLAAQDGRTLYLIDESYKKMDLNPWVTENVIPILEDVPEDVEIISTIGTSLWGALIGDFIYRHSPPQLIADWPSDIIYFCELMLIPEKPGYSHHMGKFTDMTIIRHVDIYPTTLEGAVQHNAIWDALAIKKYCEHGY